MKFEQSNYLKGILNQEGMFSCDLSHNVKANKLDQNKPYQNIWYSQKAQNINSKKKIQLKIVQIILRVK